MNESTKAGVFPEGFEYLEPYASWALATEQERHRKKCASTMQEIEAVYAILTEHLGAMIAYIDREPLDALSPQTQRLMNLARCIVTCDISVSGWRKPDLPDVFPANRWDIIEERW
jgi:hypothetical protein